MSNIDPIDWKLSMAVSKRPRNRDDDVPMRSLLVHRLREGSKAVLRLPLSRPLARAAYNVFCEPCGRWTKDVGEGGDEYACPDCGRIYVMEFAVFSVLPGSEPEKENEK